MPFDDAFNLVWVEVTVDRSRPLSFLVDSGFDGSVIDAGTAAALGLEVRAGAAVAAPGGSVEVGTIGEHAVAIGGGPSWTLSLATAPIAGFEAMLGRPLHGILGHDALARAVFGLDYAGRQLTLCDAATASFRAPVVHEVPLVIEGTSVDEIAVFADAALTAFDGRVLPARLKIDTGSMSTVGLFASFTEPSGLPVPGQPTRREPGIAVGGATEGTMFRVRELRLGDAVIPDLPVGAITAAGGFERRPYAGTVGGEVLARFHVVLDYSRARMLLAPRQDVPAHITHDGAGLRLIAGPERTFEIAAVLADSPARRAGLEPGDHIATIDGRPAHELGLAGMWQWVRRTRGPHRLEIRRDGRRVDVTLVLEDPI